MASRSSEGTNWVFSYRACRSASLMAVRFLAGMRVSPLPWVQALSQIMARVRAPSARMLIVASPNWSHRRCVTALELPPGVVR